MRYFFAIKAINYFPAINVIHGTFRNFFFQCLSYKKRTKATDKKLYKIY